MWIKNIFILFLALILISDFAFAQQIPVKKDSSHFYENIESYSKRSKFTKYIFQLIFKPVAPRSKKQEVKRKLYKKLIQKPYSAFEGKIIRKINITTLDPFGFSVTDTTVQSQNFFSNGGNDLHVKTLGITIRNLLLIHKNDTFDSLLVKESERLIRSQKYVHDVSFYVVSSGNKSDSVDIFIRELDIWSIIPVASISPTKIKVDVTDQNFLGLGHEFHNTFVRDITKGMNAYNTIYFIPNIRNTYINSTLHYGVDGYENFSKSLAFDRPFYSPFAKWAAGVSFTTQFKNDSLKDINSVYLPLKLKYNTQDYWAGNALRIFKGYSEEERVTNLILTARFLRIRYLDTPYLLNDPLRIYSNEDFYLAGIGISTRKYVQDKYIFKFGIIEDVPVGKVYGLTGGYQVKNNIGRQYVGMRVSFGNYYEWGYLSTNFEYGNFFHESHIEQGIFTAGINYFTGLFEIGKWKFRQFIKPQATIGINRFYYDSLTINDRNGLGGFYSTVLSGTSRLLFTMQTQLYAPWNFIGFHFGPYFICSLGMVGDALSGFKNSTLYSQLGLGVLIKNENLVISTFQFSISYYPVIPGNGHDVFKMNAFRTTDFGFRDFEIGKPSIIMFK